MWHPLSSCIIMHFSFWDRISHWIWAYRWASLAVQQAPAIRPSLSSSLSSLGLQVSGSMPLFYMDGGDPDSGSPSLCLERFTHGAISSAPPPPEFINEFIPHVSICHNIKTLVGPRTVCGCEGLCSPFRVCIISHELNSSSLLPFFKVPHSALIN